MRRARRSPLLLTAALFPLFLLPGCASAAPRPEAAASRGKPSDLAAVRARGRLVMVAFPHPESHFVHADLSRGPMPAFGPAERFDGVDVAIMRRFAASLGVELWVRRASEASYAALIPDLLAGQGDLIASSLSITDERKRRVAFSRPYHEVYPVVVVRAGSPIRRVEDLAAHDGSTIPGSSQEEHLRELGIPGDRLRPVSFMYENYAAVAEGDVDYTLVDSGSAARVMPRFAGLEIAFRLPGSDYYGIAVRPGSDLLPRVDAFLAEMQASGELAEIVESYSRSTPAG